jgi:hypothetical protein
MHSERERWRWHEWRRGRRRRLRHVFGVITQLAVPILPLPAQFLKPSEYQVKAAYLSNFGKFVEWPAKPAQGEPFNVCVLGQDPFGDALDAAFEGEVVDHTPVAARRIQKPEEAVHCRILFVGSSGDSQVKSALAAAGKANILTVGENPDFTKRGGMIQFVLDGNRVRFEINLREDMNAA